MKVLTDRFHKHLIACILMVGFAGFLSVLSVRAQSTSQVQIIGIPPVASSPYLSTLEKNFEAGLYRVQLMYSSTSQIPTNFRFELKLSRDGKNLVDITSDPVQYSPGMYTLTSFFDEVTFPKSITDILKGIDSKIKNQVLQGGSIPEGVYRLEIKAIPQGQTSGISIIPGVSVFTVRLPQPPILVSPSNESNVTQTIPTFAWAPVITGTGAQIDYHLKIVEIIDGQTPLQAINGNRPMADHVLTNQTTYAYTPNNLPLEKGHRYAWQVTATDPNGRIPILENGQSKIHTFIYGESKSGGNQVAGSIKDLKNITLIPGFARLIKLSGLNAQESGNNYVLSGQAVLELKLESAPNPYDVTIGVNRLTIQKGSILHPVILGGTVSAQNVPLPVSMKSLKGTVRFKDLKWQLGQSVTVSADLIAPNGKQYPGEGRLAWSKSGLSGTITAKGSSASPVMAFGKDPFRMLVTGFHISFPEAQMIASGEIDLFNGKAVFDVPSIGMNEDTVFADVNGSVNKPIYPVPNSKIMQIKLKQIIGDFAFSRKTGKGHYNIHFQGNVGFLEDPNHYCGAVALLGLSSANGFTVKDVNTNCDMSHPGIDLAGLRMKISNPRIPLLSYDPSTNKWKFSIKLDADLGIPAFNNLQLPKLKGITISSNGIQFPKFTLDQSTLESLPAIPIGGFKLNLTAFNMPKFTFPMFGSKDQKSNGWKFDMSFKLHWPKKGLGKLPPCFLDKGLTVKHATLKNGAIQGNVAAQVLDSCRVPLGPGYALVLRNLSGKLGIKLGTKPSVKTQVKLSASLEMGAPFTCKGQKGPMSLGNTNLTLLSDGHVTGDIENLVPKCPLNIGPYQATINSAKLQLTDKSGKQGAIFSTKATLHLGNKESVDGVASIDLTTGKFSKLSFDMNKPFVWAVPKNNPVFKFNIKKAHIGLDGLMIDGRQTLTMKNSKTGVTFDHMVLNLKTMQLKSGKVIIDQGVGFKSGIDQNGNLSFKAVSDTTSLHSLAGLMLNLKSTIVIDTTGAHVKGEADASLHFQKWKLDSLKARFNQNFALGFKPFGIKQGQINFYWKNQTIGYADKTGLHPDPSFFGKEFLPEKIPLPENSIAYLQIKQNDTLLVTTRKESDGTYLLNTKPGAKLKLVMPALKGNKPTAPELDVTLQDVHINPSTAQIESGTVIADVPANDATFNLYSLGIPMKLTRVAYGTDADPNQPSDALVLKGDLTLFNHPLSDKSGSITAVVAQDGYMKANVDLHNLNAAVPLDGGANRVSMVLNSVQGNLNINLNGSVQPAFNLNLDGDFQINDLNGNAVAHTGIQAKLNQHEMTVSATSANPLNKPEKIDLGALKLGITKIRNLNLAWSSSAGISYDVDLDLSMTLALSSGQDFTVPLKNIELKNNVGIIIPQQEANDNSTPPLNIPGFDVGAFHLKPIALRVPRDTISFFSFKPGDLVNLIPHVDFELSFPGFASTLPELKNTTATLSNVGFDHGILDGKLEPLTIPNGGITVPLSTHTGLKIQKISGNLGAASDGSQNYNIKVSGELQEPDFLVTQSQQKCPAKTFAIQLDKEGGLTGTVKNFTPCGQLVMGPLSLGFSNTQLDFGFSNNKQTLTMQGTATATVKTENTSPVTATGNMKLDILHGQVLSSDISLKGPFNFYYPSKDSLLKFTVQQAKINKNGFVLTGGGSLNANGKSVNVTFNNLAFDLVHGSISAGNVQIQDHIGLEVGFNPSKWAVVDPSNPISINSGLRFVLPQNISIDKNGISISGTSTVAMRYGKENGDNYQVQFHSLVLGLSPVKVTSGSADINKTQKGGKTTRIAYFDTKGFHLDNILAAVPLPDTLALPNKSTAYLLLRDGPNQPLNVQSKGIKGGLQISTKKGKSVKLVLTGLDPAGGTSVDVTFSDVDINSSFQVMGGSIRVDMSNNPINLQSLLKIPLSITSLKYSKQSGKDYELSASLKMKLPSSLNNVPLKLNDVVLGPGGFKKATVMAGEYSKSLPAHPVQHPIVTHSFLPDSNFVMSIDGAQIKLGKNKEVDISGEFFSKLLVDTTTKKMQRLHYSAGYDITHKKWNFTSNARDLANKLGLGKNFLHLKVDTLSVESTSSEFAVIMDGRISAPDIFGPDFEVTVSDFKIGTGGVSIASAGAQMKQQKVDILNKLATMTLNKMNLTFQNNVLKLAMTGNLNFLKKKFDFKDLSISSDGKVSIASGGLELLKPDTLSIIPNYVTLNSLKLLIGNSGLKVQAKGDATLPDPISATSGFTVTVDKNGKVTSQGPDFKIGNDKLPDIKIGSIADLKLTKVGLQMDLTDITDSRFYADANLNVDKKKGTPSDVNTIQFGNPSGDIAKSGIIYHDKKFNWNITNNPRFHFSTSFFDLKITSTPNVTGKGFGVKLDVDAALNLQSTSGQIELDGLTIKKAGITDFGDVKSGSFKIMNVVSVTVGNFKYQKGGTVTIPNSNGTGKNEVKSKKIKKSTQKRIQVDEYLSFTADSSKGEALGITLPGGFKGSIQKILYYKTKSGKLRFTMKDAELDFGSHAKIYAGLDFKYNSSDDFALKVMGGGDLTLAPGNTQGFRALGEISEKGKKFSFGVYFQLDASLPVVPGILTVRSLGGGFFYNGTSKDINNVVSLMKSYYTPSFSGNEPWNEGKVNSNYRFIVVFEASAGIVPSPGGYAVTATMMFVATNKFFALDATATYFGQDGTKGKAKIQGGLRFIVDSQQKGKLTVSAHGDIVLSAYKVVNGKVSVDFNAIKFENQNKTVWALTGNGDLKLLGLAESHSDLVISPKGFLLDIKINGGYHFWVISFKGGFESTVWWFQEQHEMGAYVKVSISASIFGGAVSLEADAKGALILQNQNYFIYAAAHGHIHIIAVFDGDVSVWMSLKYSHSGGKFDGGMGSNSQYDQLVADARKEGQQLKSQINQTVAAVKAAKNTPTPFKLSAAALGRAGAGLLNKPIQTRKDDVRVMLSNERTYYKGTLPGPINTVTSIITSQNKFYQGNLNTMRSNMDNDIDALTGMVQGVVTRLGKAKQLSVNLQAENNKIAMSVESPVRSMKLHWTGTNDANPPSFDIDTNVNASNESNMKKLKQNIAEMDKKYQAAIDTVRSNIDKVDEAIVGKPVTTILYNPLFGRSISFSMQPTSLNDLAKQYEKTEQGIGDFYSNWISDQWRRYYWARDEKTKMHNSEASIKNAIKIMTPSASKIVSHLPTKKLMGMGIIPGSTTEINSNKSWMNRIKNIAINRIFYISSFDPKKNENDARADRDKMNHVLSSDISNMNSQFVNIKNNGSSNGDMGKFISDINKTGNYLWYDMLYDALKPMPGNIHSHIDTLNQFYATHLNKMETAHANFTRLVDKVYSTKANMVSTLHGMIDLYARWRKSVMGDSAAAPIEQQRQKLEQLLAAPRISNVAVLKVHKYYMNMAGVSWTSSHPTGQVIENSIALTANNPSYGATIYANNLISVGKSSKDIFYFAKKSNSDKTDNYRLVIRARGPAGNTISRVAKFTVSVDANGVYNNTSRGEGVGLDNHALVKDNTPPSKPGITFYYRKNSHNYWGPSGGGKYVSSYGWHSVTRYYTNDPSRIVMQVSSMDPQSDIAGFQYAIGTYKGGTDFRKWTNAYGQRLFSGNNNSGIGNILEKITIQGLKMKKDTPYYISVRSFNGDSLISPVSYSDGVVYDATPPGKPQKAYVIHYTPIYNYGTSGNPTAVQPVEKQPLMEGPSYTNLTRKKPSFKAQWNAAKDPESGIDQYQYVVTSNPDTEKAFSEGSHIDSTENTSATLNSDQVSYKDTVYVFVRAENNAGSVGKSLRIGPIVAPDPTSPTKPKVTVQVTPANIKLYILQPSVDLESGVRNMQYAVGKNTSSDLSVQNWPPLTQNNIHFSAGGAILYAFAASYWKKAAEGLLTWSGNIHALSYDISRSGLPTGVPLYIHYRTINNQGKISSQSVTGPIILDKTPPDVPTVTLDQTQQQHQVEINVKGLHDGQSGIRKVEYKVILDYGNSNAGWGTAWTVNGLPDKNRKFSISKTVSFSPLYQFSKIKVGVRITNGNGMQRVVWARPAKVNASGFANLKVMLSKYNFGH